MTTDGTNAILSDADLAHARGSGELKPCPFCGDWAFTYCQQNPKTGLYVYHALCAGGDCGAKVHYCDADSEVARAKVVQRWNRRTS